MTQKLGSIGELLPLEVRIGDAFGPYDFSECRDESGALVDFTGSSFEFTAWERGVGVIAGFAPTVSVVALGHYRINEHATTMLSGGDFFNAKAAYTYKLRRASGGSIPVTEFFGPLEVAAKDGS